MVGGGGLVGCGWLVGWLVFSYNIHTLRMANIYIYIFILFRGCLHKISQQNPKYTSKRVVIYKGRGEIHTFNKSRFVMAYELTK